MRRLAMVLLLVAAPLSAPLSAQTPAGPTGTILGVITDHDDKPIPDVEVSLGGTGISVRSDTAGLFLIPNVPAGRAELLFRRLSYSPVMRGAIVIARDTTELEVTLSVLAHMLTAVIVDASAERRSVLEGFEARRKRGLGHFITRDEIEHRQPVLLSDMARAFPGIDILHDQRSGGSSIHFGRSIRTNCPPQYFVDNVPASGFNLDDLPPEAVEAVEFYAGPNGVPPQFNRLSQNTSCGVIVIWSRLPSPLRRKKP